jgi:hypothetical protein
MHPNEPATIQAGNFPLKVWKTIRLGTEIKDGSGFIYAIEKMRGLCPRQTRELLLEKDKDGIPCLQIAKESTEVNLVSITVADLGIKDWAFLKDIYAAAKKRGLELCPNEVGPQLFLQDKKQPPLNEELYIGMEPIYTEHGAPRMLYLDHDRDGRWLLIEDAVGGNPWRAHYRFIFMLPSR